MRIEQENFSETLKEIRKLSELKQKEVSSRLGVSPNCYASWEQGRTGQNRTVHFVNQKAVRNFRRVGGLSARNKGYLTSPALARRQRTTLGTGGFF